MRLRFLSYTQIWVALHCMLNAGFPEIKWRQALAWRCSPPIFLCWACRGRTEMQGMEEAVAVEQRSLQTHLALQRMLWLCMKSGHVLELDLQELMFFFIWILLCLVFSWSGGQGIETDRQAHIIWARQVMAGYSRPWAIWGRCWPELRGGSRWRWWGGGPYWSCAGHI